MSRRRLAAVASLAVGIATIALAAFVAVAEFPLGLVVLACLLVALASAWHGLLRRGAARALGLALAALALAAVLVLILAEGRPLENAIVVGGAALSLALARVAFEMHEPLTRVAAPSKPVLFVNPKSGGGKAERVSLTDEARSRGIETVELRRDDDLEALARGRGAVRTRSRWRAETGRRRSSPPSPRRPAFPTPVYRPGLATTSRSTSRSTATTSSGRSTRSWTPASAGSTSAR